MSNKRPSESRALTTSEKRKLTRLRADLLTWAAAFSRQFPWRSPEAGVYEKIVVEVLLQRTTANAVASFYDRFFRRYPNWKKLADARAEDLEEFLKPLGLWRRRAQSLLGLAAYATDAKGAFPRNAADHEKIPAVGQYVSNAILMFQYEKSEPLLDTNMARVIERIVKARKLADIRYDPWLQAAARWLVRDGDPQMVNWATLDFAALICKPRRPMCQSCPMRSYCNYFKSTGDHGNSHRSG